MKKWLIPLTLALTLTLLTACNQTEYYESSNNDLEPYPQAVMDIEITGGRNIIYVTLENLGSQQLTTPTAKFTLEKLVDGVWLAGSHRPKREQSYPGIDPLPYGGMLTSGTVNARSSIGGLTDGRYRVVIYAEVGIAQGEKTPCYVAREFEVKGRKITYLPTTLTASGFVQDIFTENGKNVIHMTPAGKDMYFTCDLDAPLPEPGSYVTIEYLDYQDSDDHPIVTPDPTPTPAPAEPTLVRSPLNDFPAYPSAALEIQVNAESGFIYAALENLSRVDMVSVRPAIRLEKLVNGTWMRAASGSPAETDGISACDFLVLEAELPIDIPLTNGRYRVAAHIMAGQSKPMKDPYYVAREFEVKDGEITYLPGPTPAPENPAAVAPALTVFANSQGIPVPPLDSADTEALQKDLPLIICAPDTGFLYLELDPVPDAVSVQYLQNGEYVSAHAYPSYVDYSDGAHTLWVFTARPDTAYLVEVYWIDPTIPTTSYGFYLSGE